MEGCDVIWAIKDKSISSTFVDEGAAQFFLPHLNEEKKEAASTVKRQKYTVEGELRLFSFCFVVFCFVFFVCFVLFSLFVVCLFCFVLLCLFCFNFVLFTILIMWQSKISIILC